MYDTVLVPTDGSPGTSRVLTHAVELAAQFDATLHGLCVLDEGKRGFDGGISVEEFDADQKARAERTVKRVEKRGADGGVDTETAIEEGTPHEAIVDYIDREDVDVVVMGTHGRSGVDRVLLGGVTERVVRLAPVPVLTVALETEEPVVDGEETARSVARDALAEEGRANADITVVYQEVGTWGVRAATPEAEYNVHIDAATGDAVVATLPA